MITKTQQIYDKCNELSAFRGKSKTYAHHWQYLLETLFAKIQVQLLYILPKPFQIKPQRELATRYVLR
jgi:hypothetical protein